MSRLMKNNKKTKFECGKVPLKTKWLTTQASRFAAACTDSNTKFKWSDDLVEDLRCLALLFHSNISLLVFSDMDNR